MSLPEGLLLWVFPGQPFINAVAVANPVARIARMTTANQRAPINLDKFALIFPMGLLQQSLVFRRDRAGRRPSRRNRIRHKYPAVSERGLVSKEKSGPRVKSQN